MLLANNSTYPVGLDISDLSIKLVQLNKIRDKIKIQALGKLTLPLGVITNGVINDRAELIKAIKNHRGSRLRQGKLGRSGGLPAGIKNFH